MVVKVHNEAPYIGVQITTQAKTEDGCNLVYENKYLGEGDQINHDHDEDWEHPSNVDQNCSVAEAHIHGLDVRNFHFLLYFRHQFCYCLEFSDTKTPILHELNCKKTAKIEIMLWPIHSAFFNLISYVFEFVFIFNSIAGLICSTMANPVAV